jgi:hypothetical protein
MRLVGPAHTAIAFLSVLKEPVQKRKMNRIDIALVGLQVVALVKDFFNTNLVCRCSEKIIVGKQRRLSWSHVREDDSRSFLTRIGKVLYRIPMLAAAGLPGLLQTAAADIVEPTMIEAAQSAIFGSPVAQVCSSVGAVNAQKSDAPLIVAEQDEIFAENLNGQRRTSLGQLL